MAAETSNQIRAASGPNPGAPVNDGPDGRYSAAHVDAGIASVKALVADLRYIMGSEHASRWPGLASAALQHHSPSVPDEQLPSDFRLLQAQAREALAGLCQGNFEVIRDSILRLRAIEARI